MVIQLITMILFPFINVVTHPAAATSMKWIDAKMKVRTFFILLVFDKVHLVTTLCYSPLE